MKRIVLIGSFMALLLTFASCSKDVLRHGIKGKVVYKNSRQPYANKYVDNSYYTSSCGMGIITKCGTMGESYTDADGTFKITFPVKDFHLEEGDFSVRVLQENTVTPVADVDHTQLKKDRIVNIGTIEIVP